MISFRKRLPAAVLLALALLTGCGRAADSLVQTSMAESLTAVSGEMEADEPDTAQAGEADGDGEPAGGKTEKDTGSGSDRGTASSKPEDGSAASVDVKTTTAASGTTSAKQSGGSAETPDKDTITVTVSVECHTAIAYGSSVAEKITGGTGVLQKPVKVTLKKGAVSPYDALMATELTLNAGSSGLGVYIVSIQSLAEKACGSQSGWLYCVNGVYPGKSSSKYALEDGDTVVWRYTCENGKDLA